MKSSTRASITKWVRLSLAFHNLNKSIELGLGLSLVQYHFLKHVQLHPGISSQSLSKVLGMHPSTLTQSIKRLERRGWLFVGDDPKDSRKKMLMMTRKGMSALERFEAEIERLVSEKKLVLDTEIEH